MEPFVKAQTRATFSGHTDDCSTYLSGSKEISVILTFFLMKAIALGSSCEVCINVHEDCQDKSLNEPTGHVHLVDEIGTIFRVVL